MVDLFKDPVVGPAPQSEELLVGERLDPRQFQVQHGQLRHVKISSHNVLHPLHQIIQHIASRRGDGQHDVLVVEAQGLDFNGRVLPGDVVNDAPLLDGPVDEPFAVGALDDLQELHGEVEAGADVKHFSGQCCADFASSQVVGEQPDVRANLNYHHTAEQPQLFVKGHLDMGLHAMGAPPLAKPQHVLAQKDQSNQEKSHGDLQHCIGRHGVEDEAGGKEEAGKRQWQLSLAVHPGDGEVEGGDLLDKASGKNGRVPPGQEHNQNKHIANVVPSPRVILHITPVVSPPRDQVHEAIGEEEPGDAAGQGAFHGEDLLESMAEDHPPEVHPDHRGHRRGIKRQVPSLIPPPTLAQGAIQHQAPQAVQSDWAHRLLHHGKPAEGILPGIPRRAPGVLRKVYQRPPRTSFG
mmetsp:Transcript_130129/g.296731  ORF Transcript_130129/g.296731 Transcript_130129/m.296731 type:complete len:407 (+) Transcript_130129:1566-2786(+)